MHIAFLSLFCHLFYAFSNTDAHKKQLFHYSEMSQMFLLFKYDSISVLSEVWTAGRAKFVLSLLVFYRPELNNPLISG